ncbi:MAG: TRAP transporter small permease [Beijerinckiaceae bacterium]
MRTLAGVHTWIINALAAASCVLLALFTVGICYDVLLRAAGFQPQLYVASLVEYGLLYVTVLSAPWLLRGKGHVYVDMAVSGLPEHMRHRVEQAVYVLGLITCLILAYAAFQLTWENWLRGENEVRDFDMPRWLIYLPMAVSFVLLALEFLRYLSGVDSLYRDSDRSTQL